MIINTNDSIPEGLQEERSMLSISSISNFNKKMNKGCILKVTK